VRWGEVCFLAPRRTNATSGMSQSTQMQKPNALITVSEFSVRISSCSALQLSSTADINVSIRPGAD